MKAKIDFYTLIIAFSLGLNVFFAYRIFQLNSLIGKVHSVLSVKLEEKDLLLKKVENEFGRFTIPVDSIGVTFSKKELEGKLILRYFGSECQSCLKSEKKIISNLGIDIKYVTDYIRFGDLNPNDEKEIVEKGMFCPDLDKQEQTYYIYFDKRSNNAYYYFPDENIPEVSQMYLSWLKNTFRVNLSESGGDR